MQIIAVQKMTLVDYPGKVASVVFTAGCNFRCPFCHNPESVLPEQIASMKNDMIKQEEFFDFLESRKNFLDGVVVCGGEPTIQSDLYDFIKRVKSMGLLVKLDTNGQDSKILSKLVVDGLLDYIAMDIKSPIIDYSSLSGIKTTQQFLENYHNSVDIIINSNVDYEFRTTVIKGFHDAGSVSNIAKSIKGAKRYFLQNYRAGKTIDPNFSGQSFSDLELKQFQIEADQHVNFCGIRN